MNTYLITFGKKTVFRNKSKATAVRTGPLQPRSVPYLVLRKQCFQLPLGPVIQSIREKSHGDCVDSQEIADKYDLVDVLSTEK